ncbi:MAG: hypothetical protein M1284_01995 [Candidatus Parvarchaeota archaeon]|jgi:hypothetical protein|nr:hypothetical protein [Candidatus Parvarchaeota archaeon]MCL5420505.1 hypothetical protein [Candidatus Parvarchaeota archaeon]
MKAGTLKKLSILVFFVVFLVIIGLVLFVTLLESGIISINEQPLAVSSFSCTPAGTVINIQKNVPQTINVTRAIITIGSSSYTILSGNYAINADHLSLYLSYKCLDSNAVSSVRLYYQNYYLVRKPAQNSNNFFSKLISDSEA